MFKKKIQQFKKEMIEKLKKHELKYKEKIKTMKRRVALSKYRNIQKSNKVLIRRKILHKMEKLRQAKLFETINERIRHKSVQHMKYVRDELQKPAYEHSL